MQGLILQLTRAGFLLLLWLFVWAVLRTLRSDIYAGSGVRVPPRYTRAGKVLPSLGKAKVPRYLVVTQRPRRYPHHPGFSAGHDRPRR